MDEELLLAGEEDEDLVAPGELLDDALAELRMIDLAHEPIRVDIRVQPVAGGVRLVFSTTEPSLVVAGPMPARFETPAGPATQTMIGGTDLADIPLPTRQLTEEVAIEWRLERSIEAVSATVERMRS